MGSSMNLFIFILNGGCNRIAIIFAELYGQKNYKKLRKESSLSLSAEGGFTIVLSIISLLVLYPVLGLIQTPPDVAFVLELHMGTAGTALATANSQVLTANCVCIFRVQQL